MRYIKSFQTLLVLNVTFILISACGDKYKILVFGVEQKEIEQVPLTCKMYAALAHLLINKGEERWLMIKTVFQRMRN